MRPTLLDNVSHQHLRLQTRLDPAWGDAVTAVPTVPGEFRLLQAHFPVVFQPAPQGGGFQPVALLGVGERNHFATPQGWAAHHLPWALERQPLLAGRDGDGWVVHIDADSPRLSTTEGEPLFLPQGGQSPLLARRVAVLQALHEGMQALPGFIAALQAHELLEPMSLSYERADGGTHRIGGFSVLHEERLAALPGAAVAALHEAGHWLPMAMAVASLAHFPDLIDRERRA
ncbi:MAG: SapC family protein [Roseateles sp.]|uniref:SapC family protein n=1 Tax=Roseateles sp. TaxID=1971397 RepID=UPI0039E9D86C